MMSRRTVGVVVLVVMGLLQLRDSALGIIAVMAAAANWLAESKKLAESQKLG